MTGWLSAWADSPAALEGGKAHVQLRCQRLTLQLKCDGLDAGQLARRAVEPSTMSLLGLVRHMAEMGTRLVRPPVRRT